VTRAVIDTNVVVSALLFRRGRLAWLREAWSDARVVPVVSEETLTELVRVLAYAKFALAGDEQKNLLLHYMARAETHKAPRTRLKLPKCSDAGDEPFLRLAYAAKVNALVSGDRDLLALAGESRIAIVDPATFQRMILADAPPGAGS
jgi:uncharacterized protein